MEISKKKRTKHAEQEGNELSFLGIIRVSIIFTGVFCIISALLLLVTSLVLFNTNDPSLYLDVAGKAILFVSSLLSSFLLSKKMRQRYIPFGLSLGIMIGLLVFLVSMILKGDSTSNSQILILIVPAITTVGSILGIKREKKIKHKKHK
ncbi:MAG: TIGR04086 family membrane protein [Ruminococcaceae bacterium]|nr:TIGR04086 family membrane protein [Oscillospiraceae bacterium]